MYGNVDPKRLKRFVALSQVGLEMVAPIGLGAIIDYNTGSAPWAIIVGAIIGFVGGMYHLIIIVNRPDEKNSDEGEPQK